MNINYAKVLQELQADLVNATHFTSQMEQLILQEAIIFCSRLEKKSSNNNTMDDESGLDYEINESTHTAHFYVDHYEVMIISPSATNVGETKKGTYQVENKVLFHHDSDSSKVYYPQAIKWGCIADASKESVLLKFSSNIELEQAGLLRMIITAVHLESICKEIYRCSWWDQLADCLNIKDMCDELDMDEREVNI